MRILIRVIFLLVAVALLAVGGGLAWFSSWRSEKMAALSAASSMAETSAGRVEFVRDGEGPTVLVFHAAPGGFDQAMLFGSSLSETGYQIIAPSRPGYLRTPLGSGLTPEKQADAMAALLDTLGVDHVAVLGGSMGAPAAIEFCRRYPNRVWALVLISAVAKKIPPGPANPVLPGLLNERLTGDVGSWFLVHSAETEPAKALAWCFDLTQNGDDASRENWVQAVLQNSGQLAWFRDLAGTVAPISPRETGLRNDLLQLKALPDYPWEKITVPTLWIHGTEDSFIPLADVEAQEKRMPQAELYSVSGTGHIPELGPESDPVATKIQQFLARFHGGQSAP